MARHLFGTDGIRGVAGEYPLDDPTVFAAGRALGDLVLRLDQSGNPNPQVIIGMDTRESGRHLAELLAGGLERAGVPARFAGVITTPGVAYLTRSGPFAAGVMISASHNPYQDNGIKVFAHSGFKLPDPQEQQIEEGIEQWRQDTVHSVPLSADAEIIGAYLDHLAAFWQETQLPSLRLVADCANGAAYQIAPQLFQRLGLADEIIGNRPNGRNINLGCGSLHLDFLRSAVLSSQADLGVAFDGDADRAMFISASGREVNGDAVLWMAARHLRVPQVVTTTMANLGLEKALAAAGIAMTRTDVGDKYVLEEMVRRGADLGGEQSGHIIFRRHATTGDGLLTALQVLRIIASTGLTLDQLTADLPVYPQAIHSVRVRARTPLDQVPEISEGIKSSQRELADRGRIIVRYSGTERVLRVMVEAETQELVDWHANRLVQIVVKHLGVDEPGPSSPPSPPP